MSVSYSIARVAKVKGGVNTSGIQKHVQRENEHYNNKDIDHEKTALNYDLIHGQEKQNYKELIEKRLAEGYNGKRKIRSDAIKHVDGVITSDHDFFKGMDQSKVNRFFQDSKEFLEQEYGKENMLYATVHLDEATPHMHFGFVPLTKDGRLSAKEVIGNKQALTRFQDRFHEFVKERGYDLERGESKLVTDKRHQEMDKFKESTKYHKEIAQKAERQAIELENKVDKLAEVLQPKEVKFSHYEKKTEVQQKMFGKSEVVETETGNVVLTKEHYKKLNEQVSAAHTVVRQYQKLRNTDVIKEMDRLREENLFVYQAWEENNEDVKKLSKENRDLKRENKNLKQNVKDLKANISVLYHHTKIIFKDKFRDFRERINGSMKKNGLDNQFEQEHKKRVRSKNQDLER